MLRGARPDLTCYNKKQGLIIGLRNDEVKREKRNLKWQNEMILKDLNALKNLLAKCYTEDLCYPRVAAQWNENNPCLGMCAITALVVNDLYGGEIGKIHVDSASHYFNIIDERIVDLTASQFEQSISYSDYELVDRNIMVSDTSTKLRYGALKDRINSLLSANS